MEKTIGSAEWTIRTPELSEKSCEEAFLMEKSSRKVKLVADVDSNSNIGLSLKVTLSEAADKFQITCWFELF